MYRLATNEEVTLMNDYFFKLQSEENDYTKQEDFTTLRKNIEQETNYSVKELPEYRILLCATVLCDDDAGYTIINETFVLLANNTIIEFDSYVNDLIPKNIKLYVKKER